MYDKIRAELQIGEYDFLSFNDDLVEYAFEDDEEADREDRYDLK